MNNNYTVGFAAFVALLTLTGCDGGSESGLLGGATGRATSGGVVSKVGSTAVVNDVEYDLTGAEITIDGVLARASDLAEGSVVVVEGALDSGATAGKATRVAAGTAVVGRIDALDVAGTALTVLGQTVHIDFATKIEPSIDAQLLTGLALGSEIAVSGFVDSSGAITARRIVPRASGQPLQVTGRVTGLDSANRRFAINGATVDYANARVLAFGALDLNGANVRVKAAQLSSSGALLADDVEFRDSRLPGAIDDSASLQGWVTRYGSPADFDVDGYRVVGTSDPALTRNVRLDAFVHVRGSIVAGGALRVSRVVEAGAYSFVVNNAVGDPLAGAMVEISAAGRRFQATTGADGAARFAAVPTLGTQVTIRAAGYETQTLAMSVGAVGSRGLSVRLQPVDGWAIGRAVVLGTRMVEKGNDGSTLTFAVDVAVVDRNSQPIETLTSAAFAIPSYDCAWTGCATDADGELTEGAYATGGPALSFGWQPASARRPYHARVLIVSNYAEAYWDQMVPALQSFVARVGGNDSISLSSVRLEDGVATHTVLGPFTSDGASYLDAIEELPAPPAGDPGRGEPALRQSLAESIASAAGAGAEPHVVVLAPPWMQRTDIQAVTALAEQQGVRVSAFDFGTFGVPEVASRTGGFVSEVADRRQIAMLMGALDSLLAGASPYYRMQFRLTSTPRTFVAGGNAKVLLNVAVPFAAPTGGIWVPLDVAIE